MSAGPLDPTVIRFGRAGRSSFAIDPIIQTTPADSPWVVWGGNHISNPAVY